MPSHINFITAAQRLDSRGKPTVQVVVVTDHGRFTSLVPSGASKGDYEAIELRDGDPTKYNGNGVTKAVDNVQNVLGPQLVAQKFDVASEQAAIDRFMCDMDGTSDKSRLGANAILGISMAVARAGAAAKVCRAASQPKSSVVREERIDGWQGVPLYEHIATMAHRKGNSYILPVPFFNVLNGGVHSGNPMAFQEMMIAPVGARSLSHAVQIGAEVYAKIKEIIIERFGRSAIGIGDEGGFAPPISKPHEALDLLLAAIQAAGHEGKVKIGIDPASSEFFNPKTGEYDLGMKWEKPHPLSRQAMTDLYHALLEKYPIVLLEDPFAQDDWEAWTAFNARCPVELVGDDLLATNIARINEADQKKACNALLLKVNQIGTVTESIDAARRAYELGWAVFVSHRSGETTDDFIADLTVGLGAGHLKSGSPCRGERVAKYNRLMDIEDDLEGKATKHVYSGSNFRYAHKLE